MWRPISIVVAVAGLAASLALGGCSPSASTRSSEQAVAPGAQSAGFGSALVGSALVGRGPSEIALDPATHTIYVANGNNDNGPNAGGDTVSVIDSRRCQAAEVSGCEGPWPVIRVGNLPSTIAVDQATDTVYVTDSGGSAVSVFNGSTCNAADTSGCGQQPATVPVGVGPLGIFADPANHTVYIANTNNGKAGSTTVSMLDSTTCNARHLAACPTHAPPTVDVGATPQDVTVDLATDTVYVTTIGARNGWAVFNATTCNATTQSGCTAIGRLAGDSAGPNSAQIDPANDTLYTANYDNTVSAFDLRHCDAADLAGCAAQNPGTVTPFPQTDWEHDLYLAVDVRLHSVYVTYQGDDSLVVIDADRCSGRHPAGCSTLNPPTIHTGASPESVMLDQRTQTIYTVNEAGNDISVIAATRCNATSTAGCRHPAPAFQLANPFESAADPAARTLYVLSSSGIYMIDTAACSTRHLTGCSRTPASTPAGASPDGIAVDGPAHTIYIANSGTGTVSVLDDRTCNATNQSGCGRQHTLQVPGGSPQDIGVDPATGTLYVASSTAKGPDLVSVFSTATCDAASTAGCGQAPAVIKAGPATGASQLGMSLAVNPVTNTIYLTVVATGSHDVYVINGATCDATDHAGCGQTTATINAGFDPWGIAVDQATDTIYTANYANGDYQGTVSVINGATCNGTDHHGCNQVQAKVTAGYGAFALAIDQAAGTIYVVNLQDTSISVINGRTCNRTTHSGCQHIPAKIAVGNYPHAIAIDPAHDTAYISNYDNTISLIRLGP
jgi:DNA-binding beta-propeller fold protein YncE